MPDTHLAGCHSRPLIGYLKALGLLRILSKQADHTSRGRWVEGVFELRSELSGEEMVAFLLDDYAPSPVISPWNGGSGFHPKDRREAIETLEQATQPRFTAYRDTIHLARETLARLGLTDKPSAESKPALIRALRRRVPDEALPWLDATIVVTGTKVSYPPLLGSGGNDGRYDFSNNFAQAVVSCLVSGSREDSRVSLSAALSGGATELQRKLSLGHLSRDTSPTNSPYGEADSLGNPWDLILAVEGTLLLVAGAARRLGAVFGGALVAPFTVYSTAAGYGSAVSGESGRAELWLPLWSQWASCAEISVLSRESRAQVGRGNSRRQARTGLDFARAAGTLGVARGIDEFERYAILERAGQSSLAVPAGRVSVSERPGAASIQSIDRWLSSVIRFGASEHCPRGIAAAVHKLERSSFALASRGEPRDACETLEALGAVEQAFARSRTAIEAPGMRPLSRVSAAPWVATANDKTPEFAIAVAIASLHDRKRRLPALRDYLNGTQDGGSRFDADRRHAVHAHDPIQLLAAIHLRRHLDAASNSAPKDQPSDVVRKSSDDEYTPHHLEFDHGTWCPLHVVRRLVVGELDEPRVLRLVRGLALLEFDRPMSLPTTATTTSEPATPAFDVLAVAWMGNHLEQLAREARQMLGPRPGWAARLAAGATRPVLVDAMLRLRMAMLAPIATPRDICADDSSGRQLGPRLCAALLLQVGPTQIKQIADRITFAQKPYDWNQPRKETA